MPDSEIDEVVASAFGLASYHLQNALLTALVAKGALTMKEAALTFQAAHHELEKMKPTPMARQLKTLALQALAKSCEGWTKQAKGN
jgi:hypothetical protein